MASCRTRKVEGCPLGPTLPSLLNAVPVLSTSFASWVLKQNMNIPKKRCCLVDLDSDSR